MNHKRRRKLSKWAEKAYRASIADIEREFVEAMGMPESVSGISPSTETATVRPRMDIPKPTYRQIYTEHAVLFPYGAVNS